MLIAPRVKRVIDAAILALVDDMGLDMRSLGHLSLPSARS